MPDPTPCSYIVEPDRAQPGWWIIRILVNDSQVAWTKVRSWAEAMRYLSDRESANA